MVVSIELDAKRAALVRFGEAFSGLVVDLVIGDFTGEALRCRGRLLSIDVGESSVSFGLALSGRGVVQVVVPAACVDVDCCPLVVSCDAGIWASVDLVVDEISDVDAAIAQVAAVLPEWREVATYVRAGVRR